MSELEGDRYLIAINGYLNARHNIALRLLAECDKEAEEDDIAKENKLRDDALTATVARCVRTQRELPAWTTGAPTPPLTGSLLMW